MNRNSTIQLVAGESDQSPVKTVGTANSMRASIIRVDSPVRAQKPNHEPQQRSARAPLAEMSPSVANGTTSTTSTFTPGDGRRLTMPPLSSTLLKKTSMDRLDSPVRPNGDVLSVTPSENEGPGWSSAVGHATTSGKSGRVIERLMAENDRLRRDLELQLLRSQELERNLQTIRPQMEALKAENSNLSHLKSVDGSLLSRRDRKIDALKEELTGEKARREASEALLRKTVAERDNAAEAARREVQQAQEEAKHATLHATILEQSHRQLATDYRTRAERWRKDLNGIEAERKVETQKLSKLEVVADQMRTELERSRKMHTDLSAQFETYRGVTDRWREEIESMATNEHSRSKALSDDMQTVVDKMRWVIANHARQQQDEIDAARSTT